MRDRPISGRWSGAVPTVTPDPPKGADATVGRNCAALCAVIATRARAGRYRSMPLKTVQIIAALIAAVAFVLAFIAAGMFLVSSLFMAVGLAAVAWLTRSLIRQVRARRPGRPA